MMNAMKKCPNTGLFLIRVAVAMVFLYAGINKLMVGGEAGGAMFASMGITMAPMFWFWVVALVETLGGAAMLLGVWTQCAGYLLAFIMLVAIILVHWSAGYMGMQYPLVMMLVSLGIAMVGPGTWALMREK
ncbi:MAG: DoxX family protein [Patescibacteria group bacterium]